MGQHHHRNLSRWLLYALAHGEITKMQLIRVRMAWDAEQGHPEEMDAVGAAVTRGLRDLRLKGLVDKSRPRRGGIIPWFLTPEGQAVVEEMELRLATRASLPTTP